MRNIAIIPARSGSKGVKDKNIRELAGRPLMAYTISAALESDMFDVVMVSTDSERYAGIARALGAEVPFLRSSVTSADTASSWEMVDEVLGRYEEAGEMFDTFCLLQPTSPLRTGGDIVNAYHIYREWAEFAVVSVCEAEHSPLWCGHLPANHELIEFTGVQDAMQRQAGRKFYRLNGAIYIVNAKKFKTEKNIYRKGSFAYVMSQERSVDIDTELDFKLASVIIGGVFPDYTSHRVNKSRKQPIPKGVSAA